MSMNSFKNIHIEISEKRDNFKSAEVHYDVSQYATVKSLFKKPNRTETITHHVINLGVDEVDLSIFLKDHIDGLVNPYEGMKLLDSQSKQVIGVGDVILPQIMINDHDSYIEEVEILKGLYQHDFSAQNFSDIASQDKVKAAVLKSLVNMWFKEKRFKSLIKKVTDMSEILIYRRIRDNETLVNGFFVTLFEHSAGLHLCELWEQSVNTIKDGKVLLDFQHKLIDDMAECYQEVKEKKDQEKELHSVCSETIQQEEDNFALDMVESQRMAIKELMMKKDKD